MRDELWAGTEASLDAFLKAQEKSLDLKASDYDDDDEDESIPHLLEVHGNVGVVSIKGPLTNDDSFWNRLFGITSYNDIRAAIIAAASDTEVNAILLDIDSGGGAVNGVMDTASLIRMVNDKVKPVVSFSDGTMASAAYWLGMSAGEVNVSRTANAGSIGVITTHMEKSKMLKDEGINVTVMRSGKYKALANPYEPLTEEAKSDIQRKLDATYSVFTDQVAIMRGKPLAYVNDVMADGREFTGDEAVNAGLADHVTSFDALLSSMQESNQQQTLDKFNFAKQNPCQQQKDSYFKGTSDMKKALTEQQIAALAEGAVNVDASIDTNPEANTEAEHTDPVASEETASVAETPVVSAQAETQDSQIVSFLQSQIAEKDKAIIAANIEVSRLKESNDALASSVGGLMAIASKSLSNISVALGHGAVDASTMQPVALLAEHKRLSEQFLTKYKAGGVAAVDAADAKDEAEASIDPMHKFRLAMVRATAKA